MEIQRNLRCILLNGRSQSEKATYCVIPTIWHFEKCKTTETGKNLPAMQETRVQSLGWEDSLEKGLATHSSIHAGRIPWTEEPWRLQSTGWQATNTHTHRNSEKISGCQGSAGRKGWTGRVQRTFRTVKPFCMILQWWTHVKIYRIYDPKNEPWCTLWTLSDNDATL